MRTTLAAAVLAFVSIASRTQPPDADLKAAITKFNGSIATESDSDIRHATSASCAEEPARSLPNSNRTTA